MNKKIFGAVLSMFIFLTTSSGIANIVNIESSTTKSNYIFENDNLLDDAKEMKQLLYSTIIDLAYNYELRDIIEKYDFKIEMKNNDLRNLLIKLLVENPRLVISILLIKPTITRGYLNYAYNQGYELLKILDESEVKLLTQSIVNKDNEMIEEIDKFSDTYNMEPLERVGEGGVICTALYLMYFPLAIYFTIIFRISDHIISPPIVGIISMLPYIIAWSLDCDWT